MQEELLLLLTILPKPKEMLGKLLIQLRLPGIITLGYISAFDESLAMSVIACKGIAPLKVYIKNY
jgi:hypothetical protein